MPRPKSSWAEIIGAVGAASAAAGAGRAAQELRNLRSLQEQSLAAVQNYLEWERRRREAEDHLRESVRKLKQAAFDFSEALAGIKQDIQALLPDWWCAAALFYETGLQLQAEALYEKRELLESYEDKKLVKNCLEGVRSIRASIEEQASADGLTFDQIAESLLSRRSKIKRWRGVLSETDNTIRNLSQCVSEWSDAGPDAFLESLQRLGNEMTTSRAALGSFAAASETFQEVFAFVSDHPNITNVWPDALYATADMVHGVESKGRALLAQAETVTERWKGEVGNFNFLKDSFSGAKYEDFLERLEGCTVNVTQLPELKEWTGTAKARLQRASQLIEAARDEVGRRNWRTARTLLREAMAVPCSQRLRTQLDELNLAVMDGLLPTRAAWLLGLGAILFLISYWLGILRWLLLAVCVLPVVLLFGLRGQIVASRRAGASWRAIFKGLLAFFLRLRIVWR